jgi:hypothetical protein
MQAPVKLSTLPFGRVLASLFLVVAFSIAGTFPVHGISGVGLTNAFAKNGCVLNSANPNVSHVIYLQFDNVHFTRDNPNVPSDLQQMPHLLNFIKGNGVLLANHHTPLISHTANDELTSLTGVYPDRHGVPVANTFRYFNPNGTTNPGVSFDYWTNPIYDYSTNAPTDTKYNMLAANGKNAPAPWVPFARAGCNVGAYGMLNIVPETASTDVPKFFGPNSPQAKEVKTMPDQANADFLGVAVHCARSNAVCSSSHGGVADKLPDEPAGYSGYSALFGNKYVAKVVSPSGPVKDLNGNVITDGSGHVGFPAVTFDPTATQSLAYVAAMQEHGIPVTYGYIADAHDIHTAAGGTYGPGEAGYVAQLKAYDTAFAKFFANLAAHGINQSNTVFMITADEGDHFVGGPPSPKNCNGVTTPCTYKQIGEIDANLTGLLKTQQGIATPFKVHADSAPTFYITGNPARDNKSVTRPFERAVSRLTAVNPITKKTDRLTGYLADPVEMKLLHMVTADPARTPTFTMFGNPNYYLYTGDPVCSAQSPCVSLEGPTGSSWNHGDVAPDINRLWLAIVGPGVAKLGVTSNVWTDETDIRPTLMQLTGLRDDYLHDGRVITEVLKTSALTPSEKASLAILQQIGADYKMIEAPVGSLGLDSLTASTRAIQSGTMSDDFTYAQIEQDLSHLTDARNDLGTAVKTAITNAEFYGRPISAHEANTMHQRAVGLLAWARDLAEGSTS